MSRATRYSERARLAFVGLVRSEGLRQVSSRFLRSFVVRTFRVSGSTANSLTEHLTKYFIETGVLVPSERANVYGVAQGERT